MGFVGSLLFFGLSVLFGLNTFASSALLSEIENKYKSSESISMNVAKTVKLKLLQKEKSSSGTIQIKKGGKLRWETSTPEHSLVLSDGKSIWLVDYPIDEDEKPNVIKATNPKHSQPHAVVAFLMGEGKISDSFNVKKQREELNGQTEVDLVPKDSSEPIKRLKVLLESKSQLIQQMDFEDAVGNETELRFSNIEFNAHIDNKNFVFKPPKGAEMTVLK